MMHMKYSPIKGEDLPDYANNYTWNILRSYIDAHSQRLIDKYPGGGLHAITRLKSQSAKIIFYDKSM